VNPELGDLMNEAEQAVLGFLNLAMASRIETIKAVVRPFCESDGIAEQVAKMTTSYQVGAQMVWLLSSGSDRVRGSGDVRAAVATLRNLETLLCESLKEHPDFNQWISVTPAAVGSPT
jgi:AcrR family transcriptional regulator